MPRCHFRAVIAVAGLLALAACVSDGEAVRSVPEPDFAGVAPPPRDQSLAAIEPSPAIEPSIAFSTPAAPPVVYPELATLMGQPAAQVTTLLGAPNFRRRDKPAELWQYQAEGCILNLFLYPGGGHELQVDHIEVQDRTEGPSAATPVRQVCFVNVLKAKAAEEAS